MLSTMCTFVRDRTARQIVWHRVEEWDSSIVSNLDRVHAERHEATALAKTYPPDRFEVFVQGFDSRESLYSAWPELKPGQTT